MNRKFSLSGKTIFILAALITILHRRRGHSRKGYIQSFRRKLRSQMAQQQGGTVPDCRV